MTQHCGDGHLSVLSAFIESKKWLRHGRANAKCPIQGDDGLIEVSIERGLTVPIELRAGQSH